MRNVYIHFRRAPQLFQKDTKYLTKIFEALKKVVSRDVVMRFLRSISGGFFPFLQKLSADVSLAVQECLSLMAAAYRGVQGQSALIIEALLLENIYSVWHKVAHVYIY